MTEGTDNVGPAGRFGPRYGTSVRRRVEAIERNQFSTHRCPQCLTGELKRESTSVWLCRKCDHKFAGGAYIPRTPSFGKAQAPTEELAEIEGELEDELEAEAEPGSAEEADEEPSEEPEQAEELPEEPEQALEEEEPKEPEEAEDEAPEEEAEDEAAEDEDDEPRDIGTLFED